MLVTTAEYSQLCLIQTRVIQTFFDPYKIFLGPLKTS